MATIQGVYIALFGRPADPLGLAYFNEVTKNGADLTAIGDLAATDEYQNRFAGMTNVQIINSIYQSLFGRDADLAGLTFFATALTNGTYNINNIAIAIYDGARGTDAEVLANKEAAANLFTASLDTGAEVVAYQGDGAAAQGRAFLSTVTADDATIPTQAEVDAAIAAIVANPGGDGETFTLTANLDNLVGTAAGDTFQGDHANLGAFDRIEGGAGVDTLNLIGAGGAGALDPNASISGVEIVNINTTAAILGLDSSYFAGVQQIWQIGQNADITVGSGVTAGFRNTNVASSVIAADGVSSVNVALNNVTSGSVVTIAETTAGDVTSATVSGSVAAVGAVTINTAANTTAVETVNIGLSSNGTVTLVVDNAVTTTVNAAASTGNLTIDVSAITALESFVGGSGGDIVTAAHGAFTADAVVINAGAGNDTINYGIAEAGAATTATLTGGAGNDAFVLTTGGVGNLAAAGNQADLLESLIIISDFTASADVLDISGLNGGAALTLQNTVNGAVAGQTSLFAAVDAVAGVTANGDFSVFNFGGNTYIYGETGGADGLDAGDTLIQVTGVSVAELNTSTNFVL